VDLVPEEQRGNDKPPLSAHQVKKVVRRSASGDKAAAKANLGSRVPFMGSNTGADLPGNVLEGVRKKCGFF
jgi:hypothetical protein